MSKSQPDKFDFNFVKKELDANAVLLDSIKLLENSTEQRQKEFMEVVNEIRQIRADKRST
jgi:hypothetical protein